MFNAFFNYLDKNSKNKNVKLFNQLFPIFTCIFLFGVFMVVSYIFIVQMINPSVAEDVLIELHFFDVFVGFFLYFVTAVDYALIVGRMQIANPGAKARFVMNVCTCVGCFFGVSIVLFLWGFAKEIPLLIIGLLVFAGSIMIKLAFEGREYFEHSSQIPYIIRTVTTRVLEVLHEITSIFTFWIPDLGSPKVEKMRVLDLAKWSLFLPFIIGLDDLVGYMGAMTIYNVFSLLFGIYLADILIDMLIFVSPSFTKKMVENSVLSLIAAFAFLYLGYKSFSESLIIIHEHFHFSTIQLALLSIAFIVGGAGFNFFRRKYAKVTDESEHVRGQFKS